MVDFDPAETAFHNIISWLLRGSVPDYQKPFTNPTRKDTSA